MRAAPILLAATLAARLAASAPQSQAPTLEDWLTAIDTHVPGDRDAPARLVGTWSRAELNALVPQLQKQARQRNNPAWLARTLKRAALFHADIAMLNRISGGYSLPPDDRNVIQFRDGRHLGYGADTFHWGFGRYVLALVPAQAADDDYTRRWYRATSAFLHYWRDYAELKPHLAQWRALFADDAALWLYDGALHEYFAEPEVQQVAAKLNEEQQKEAAVSPPNRQSAFTSTTSRTAPLVSNASDERATAEDGFRKALKFDPKLAEARVRLGRVLGLRGQHANAVTELTRALADTDADLLQYYALLFIAQSQHALGKTTEARRAYEDAAALFPGVQSPHLGLSLLAHDVANREGAVAELTVLSRRPARLEAPQDPWWFYFITHVPDSETLVEALRRTEFQ